MFTFWWELLYTSSIHSINPCNITIKQDSEYFTVLYNAIRSMSLFLTPIGH